MHTPKSQYDYDDLIASGEGRLFGDGNAQLPKPPMLMFDRITAITENGGAHEKGEIKAEYDIKDDAWFFPCHFNEDPVMPGCLGLDAMWQLVGFFLGWGGSLGRGRALGVGEVKFTGQVTPNIKLVTYHIEMKRVIRGRLVFGIGEGVMAADGKVIYKAKDLRVGLFKPEQM